MFDPCETDEVFLRFGQRHECPDAKRYDGETGIKVESAFRRIIAHKTRTAHELLE